MKWAIAYRDIPKVYNPVAAPDLETIRAQEMSDFTERLAVDWSILKMMS